jgi:hypothetical protein
MLTRKLAKGKRSDDPAKTAHAATALLNNIAEASYQAIGLTKKKKSADDTMSQKGEKVKSTDKLVTDEYYDDRLSRDSQLDDNLKSLVSSRPPSAAYGHLSTDLDTVSGEDDTQIEDEFYGGTSEDTAEDKDKSSLPPRNNSTKSTDFMTADEMGAMMGDWQDSDIPSPNQGPQKRQATSSPGQGASDTSLLSVDVPVRHDPKRIAMAERQIVKVVKVPLHSDYNDSPTTHDQLADIPILKQQLSTALQDIANLKIAMDEQFDTLTRTATAVGAHGVAIDNLQNQSEMFRQKLVDVEVRTDNACADIADAKLAAQKSEAVAKKSMEVAQACSAELKSLEKRMAALRKIQDDMVLNVSRIQDRPSQQQGVPPSRIDELSENSIFLAGIPSIRGRLKMPSKSDPVFVVSCFLRELEIYSGMDNIVIADNAAQTRAEARAVIIHMRSNFHKRGAMGTLKRELARQKMADTAVRDCFPTTTMEKVKRYIRFAMKLKAAGTIDKFQIINRRGQPILQVGKRAGTYADYQGDIEEEDQAEETGEEKDDGPWTTVGKKGKKISASATAQHKPRDGPAVGGAAALPPTWAQMTENDFPELPAAAKKDGSTKTRPQEVPAPNTQRQQQLNDINIKLQQLSATPTANSNGTGVLRPQEPRRNVSRNNSRGSSKNNSRRTSRERASGGHRYNSNQRNSTSASPPPFQSYFKGRSYNNSGETGAIPKYRSGDTQQQLHEQHHRKR